MVLTFRRLTMPPEAKIDVVYMDTGTAGEYGEWVRRPTSEVPQKILLLIEKKATLTTLDRDDHRFIERATHRGWDYAIWEFKTTKWRCFYVDIGQLSGKIVLLHLYAKKSRELPKKELRRALLGAQQCIDELIARSSR